MGEFVKVFKASDLAPGRCRSVEAGGLKIAIFNIKGTLYAIEDSCSHLGAPLSLGFPGKDSISCEWHGATFDLRTGEPLSPPARTPVAVYNVRINGEDVEVEI